MKQLKMSIAFIIFLNLFSCAGIDTKNTNNQEEVFDVKAASDFKQISYKAIKGGWMYEYTNNGLPAKDVNVTKKMIVMEVNGKLEPYRLSDIFPKNCYELKNTKEMKEGYLTWVDILICPEYQNTSKGLLVINKSIQGKKEFFGATEYINTPILTKKVYDYNEIPISNKEKESITYFIRETKINKDHK